MPTALEQLSSLVNDLAHQDMPLQSIKGELNDLLSEVEMSGGSQTWESRAEYLGGNTPVSIANGANDYLTWDNLGDGPELLDRSDLKHPVVIEGGIYAVSAIVRVQSVMTGSGVFTGVLHLDATDKDAVGQATSGGSQNTMEFATIPLPCTYYIPAGGEIAIQVFNYDGAASRGFMLVEAAIQLLPGGP